MKYESFIPYMSPDISALDAKTGNPMRSIALPFAIAMVVVTACGTADARKADYSYLPAEEWTATQAPIAREVVAFEGDYTPGTIVVSTTERRLYFVTAPGEAIRYGVGVGRPGFEWQGEKTITRMAEWPDWTPPAEMIKRRPDLPRHMAGGIENPLGARAMYLGGTMYRIHGSNEPDSIGQAVSSGCIRMTNDDVTDLYTRVKIGTKVVVI